MRTKKSRFINEDILKEELPLFYRPVLSSIQIEMMIDRIEEELILKKADEIKQKRINKSYNGVF